MWPNQWRAETNQKAKIKKQNYNPKIKNSKNRPIRAKKVENRSVSGEYYLKKQSQFLRGRYGVKLILTMVYGDFNGWRQLKNKAKQSQFVRSAFCVLRTAKRNFKKQSQFWKGQNEPKLFNNKII